MELYFLRHGIAADVGPDGLGDGGRPLTKAGIAKMQAAARGMRRLDLRPDALLSSPLVRAHETAAIVARELEIDLQLADQLSPGCDSAQLFALLGQHRAAERVMLVGHEPDLSALIGALTGGSRVLMKKGGLGRVDTDLLEDGAGTLVWLLPPRALRAADCG
jgi:phosphohistidine phosphatase